jgi:hypothetical protein
MDRAAINCTGDDDAKVQTKGLVDGHIIELWQGGRRVGIFTPEK